MEMNPYIVYVKTNSDGYIITVNSSAFLQDTTDWVEIDSGFGDKYHHAQGYYFPEPITDDGEIYRYKLAEGVPTECTAEEIAEQKAVNKLHSSSQQTLEQRVTTVESNVANLTAAIEKGLNL